MKTLSERANYLLELAGNSTKELARIAGVKPPRNGTVKDARAALNSTFDAMAGGAVAATATQSIVGAPTRCYTVTSPSASFYDPWGKAINVIPAAVTSPICATFKKVKHTY